MIITTSSIRPPLATKKARILAVTSEKRSTTYPDVPTLAESGYPGFDLNDWCGLFAAEGTPPVFVQRMYEAVAEAAKDAKLKERLDPAGAEMVANTPAEFGVWLKSQRGPAHQADRRRQDQAGMSARRPGARSFPSP